MLYNRKVFGVVISRLRVQKGLTQESLSGLAGIARSHLAVLESGEKTAEFYRKIGISIWNYISGFPEI